MELRDLPSVDTVIADCSASSTLPSAVVAHVARTAVNSARAAILAGDEHPDPREVAATMLSDLEAARPMTVINATGVLLHTNLGRAPIHPDAASIGAGLGVAAGNVEIDVRTGRRAKRHDYLRALLRVVTGAEDGFAVNNNAGGLLLALASVAGGGGRVAVSRGELIEIGGSFRLPALMEASGAELVEVGTTNRTRLSDFGAVAGSVDAILKVHPSNYRIDGFSEEASYEDLVALAHDNDIPLIADVGSGLMDQLAPWVPNDLNAWLKDEPGVKQTVAFGADIVLFSGDKLIGGPQAGLVVGTKEAVGAAKSHPIARAVRLDGSAIASLATTLEMYADNRVRDIPFWAMATASLDSLRQRATKISEPFSDRVEIVASRSVPGAGSVPGETIPSVAIRLSGSADANWSAMASMPVPVIATRHDGAVFIDIRSVLPHDDAAVASAISSALR
jgi:L-seryl-tRNA(Ser) seleniumtransferase